MFVVSQHPSAERWQGRWRWPSKQQSWPADDFTGSHHYCNGLIYKLEGQWLYGYLVSNFHDVGYVRLTYQLGTVNWAICFWSYPAPPWSMNLLEDNVVINPRLDLSCREACVEETRDSNNNVSRSLHVSWYVSAPSLCTSCSKQGRHLILVYDLKVRTTALFSLRCTRCITILLWLQSIQWCIWQE